MKSKISYAVAAILNGVSVSALADAPAAPSDTAESSVNRSSDALSEVVVTAQRRSQNMQDVPIAMQALTAETLQQLSISTFDDYIRYLPNVTAANNGPGQNEIFMRGVSGGSQPSQGSASTGLWPNVAIYLDNQSGQLPNRNLDIYAADLNRIEVLEGPQGTLFGAGAEAGVIRYITNEPKLDVTEANVKAGYGTTAHGDPNTDVTAMLNLPLIANTMAVRAVIYNDVRGGYIDNVPATFTRKNTDIGIYHAYLPANALGQCPDGLPNNGFCVPPGSPVINNNNLVANSINSVTYQGIRAELLYKFNDNWDALITQSYQTMNSQGVFYQQPYASDGGALQPLQVTLFNPAHNKDKFESTAWTLNGKFGDLNFVYTGGYLVRNVDQVGDYTNYARGLYADYYQCYGPNTAPLNNPQLKPTCFSPSAIWHETQRNQNLQQELRLSTPDNWRLRGIAGAYWQDNKLYDQTAWMYKTIPPCTSTVTTGCITNVAPFPGTTVQNPNVQSDNTSFYQDQVRTTKQTAFFASVDFDLIPSVLTITAGTRWFQFKNSLQGSVLSSFDCFQAGAPGSSPVVTPGCHGAASYDLNAMNLNDTESGFKSRANLTWNITPDAMVYYTFSQGFRPGGFNQNGGAQHGAGTDGVPQYILSPSYQSDSLTNNEIGWKTLFFNHRLQWNGAIYRENLDNVQVAFFDPGVIGNIFYNANGQNYLIKGLETSLIARITTGLTLQGAVAWNHSEQTNSPELIDNNPASNNYGKPITQVCPTGLASCTPVPSPYGPAGAPAANAPPMQFNVRARYEWVTGGGYIPYVQFGATHTDHSFTQAGSNPTFAVGGALSTSRGRFEVPSYSTFEASCGVAKDAWNLDLYVQNLTNSNAATFISAFQFIVAETPLRPRVIGGSFGYKF